MRELIRDWCIGGLLFTHTALVALVAAGYGLPAEEVDITPLMLPSAASDWCDRKGYTPEQMPAVPGKPWGHKRITDITT